MRKKILGVMLSIMVLLVLIIAMAPANTVLPLIQSKLPAQAQAIKFGEINGSIWSPEISRVQYQQHEIQNLSADISPLSLLFGDLNANINIKDPQVIFSGELTANSNSVLIENASYQLSAKALNPLMKFPVKALSGTLSGDLEEAQVAANQKIDSLAGEGIWTDAVIYYFNNQLALGNFKYQISTDEQKNIQLEILDNQGVLDIKGFFVITPDKDYRLDISMREQLPAAMERWIKQLGKLENNRYKVQWNGKIQ